MGLLIAVEPLDSPESQRLVRALDDYLSDLYPPEDNFLHLAADELAGGRGTFVVARRDDVPVGCGAVRRLSDSTAEIKRLSCCRQRAVKAWPARCWPSLNAGRTPGGISRLVLETGVLQVEAIGFFARNGFLPIPRFGEYATSPTSICYQKALPRLRAGRQEGR